MTTGVTNQNKGQKENMSRYNNYDTRDCVYNFCKDFILEHGYDHQFVKLQMRWD